jgi:bacterioferritin-associated ferredoxin
MRLTEIRCQYSILILYLLSYSRIVFMYVCLCQVVTEKDIRKAVDQGISSMEMLANVTKVGTQCGCCADHAHEVFQAAVSAGQENRH